MKFSSTGFFIIIKKSEIKMANKITKNNLIENIYKNTDCDKKDIQVIVDSFLQEVKKSLENGSTIELRGFGTFEPRLRKGRSIARNPKTGETLSVEPHIQHFFISNHLFTYILIRMYVLIKCIYLNTYRCYNFFEVISWLVRSLLLH